VRLPRGVDHGGVLERLAADGVEAGHYVPCVHLQPYMRELYGFGEGLCPAAEDAAARSVALPFFPAIEPEDQERVVEALRSAVA
jgi:perosamine synthetase